MSEINYEAYLPEVGKKYTPGTRYRNRNGDSEWSYPSPEERLARTKWYGPGSGPGCPRS